MGSNGQANFDDFSEHESDKDCEVAEVPHTAQGPNGQWFLHYLGMSVALPNPRKTGYGRWIVEMDPHDRVCSVTDGVRSRLASNLVTIAAATMFLGCA